MPAQGQQQLVVPNNGIANFQRWWLYRKKPCIAWLADKWEEGRRDCRDGQDGRLSRQERRYGMFSNDTVMQVDRWVVEV